MIPASLHLPKQHRHKDTALYTSCDEFAEHTGICEIPVGERHTARSLVGILPEEVGNLEEVGIVGSQRCSPKLPVAIGV